MLTTKNLRWLRDSSHSDPISLDEVYQSPSVNKPGALAIGAAHGLGLQSYIKLQWITESDSSSAKACASRGLEKQRHSQKLSLVDPGIACSKQLGDQESTDNEQHRSPLDESG